MSAITLNTFPSINSFTSSRAWFLAIIVLLHAGFVWMLSNGLTFRTILQPDRTIVEFLPDDREILPPRPLDIDDAPIDREDQLRVLPPKPVYVEEKKDDVISGPRISPVVTTSSTRRFHP